MIRTLEPETVIRWIGAILVFAIIFLVIIVLIYVSHFSESAPPEDARAAWGQFGDFVGGTSNPVLALLTLTGVLITLILQIRQLQNSKQELFESRSLLAQSNKSQEQAAMELSKQALASRQSSDLAGVNLLLVQYRAEIGHLRSQGLAASDPLQSRIADLETRERELLRYIDAVYDRILQQKP
jgi:hypothetical protein